MAAVHNFQKAQILHPFFFNNIQNGRRLNGLFLCFQTDAKCNSPYSVRSEMTNLYTTHYYNDKNCRSYNNNSACFGIVSKLLAYFYECIGNTVSNWQVCRERKDAS